jgi:hypothetical protein
MDCYQRAASDQVPQIRQENLNQANRLSRTYTTLLETLNRKGSQQKVTVEHVHVYPGG